MAGSNAATNTLQWKPDLRIADDGTLPRTAMPLPGVIGVNNWEDIPPEAIQMIPDAVCLQGLFREMSRQTVRFLSEVSRNRHYLTGPTGVRYIPEDWADAFGHCWIACQGTRSCGEGTGVWGTAYEYLRELQSIVGYREHNSFTADLENQRIGRDLATRSPNIDCFECCYQVVVEGRARRHFGRVSQDDDRFRIYLIEPTLIEERQCDIGWTIVPRRVLDRY